MDPSLYIVSVLGLAVLLAVLLLGFIIGMDRLLVRRSRTGDAVRLRVELSLQNGVFTANYDQDRGRPKNVPSAASLAEICGTLDEAIIEQYQRKVPPEGVVVSYDILPWRAADVPKGFVAEVGADFLVFTVTEGDDGFRATHKLTRLSVAAASLDDLPGAVEAAILSRWPSFAPDVPAALNWERTLTDVGLRALRE